MADWIDDEVKAALKTPDFDCFSYTHEQLTEVLAFFYDALGLVETFGLHRSVIARFVDAVRRNYNDTPFHNFLHCFNVSQMVYVLLTRLQETRGSTEAWLTPLEQLSLLMAANMHDLDHPGRTNSFQVNTRSPLAMVYNDQSPLENHHASVGFGILAAPTANVLAVLTPEDQAAVRAAVIECVLATDMARHFEIKGNFDAFLSAGATNSECVAAALETPSARTLLMQVMLCVSDISNEVRPFPISRPWGDRLLQEFFAQGDDEAEAGLVTMSFMDRNRCVQEHSQVSFMGHLQRPIWVSIATLFPELEDLVDRLDDNYKHWAYLLEHNNSRLIFDAVVHGDNFKTAVEATTFAKGDVVVRKGEVSSDLYFLDAGHLQVVSEDATVVFDEVDEGCFFGEIGAFKKVPRTATIVCASDEARVYVIDAENLSELSTSDPEHADQIKAVADMHMTLVQRREMHEFTKEDLVELGG